MAANWHLGDVGSTTDFSINASLGHPGAPYSSAAHAGGSCEGRGVPGCRRPTVGRLWTSMQERVGVGLVTVLLSSKIRRLNSGLRPASPSFKKETVKSLPALNSDFAFSESVTAAR